MKLPLLDALSWPPSLSIYEARIPAAFNTSPILTLWPTSFHKSTTSPRQLSLLFTLVTYVNNIIIGYPPQQNNITIGVFLCLFPSCHFRITFHIEVIYSGGFQSRIQQVIIWPVASNCHWPNMSVKTKTINLI